MAEELEGNFIHSYTLQTETPIDISEIIYSLEPKDLPFLTGVGADGIPLIMRSPTGNTTFKWMEERAPLPRGAAAEAIDSSETVIDVATGDAVKFAVGDTVRIDNELMKVTDLDTAAETITVVRAWAGTSAATHDSGDEIIGVGTVLPEGDVGSANFVGRDLYTNYTQIWTKTIRVSGTEQVIRKYGIPNELNHQLMKQTHALMLAIEQSALYGTKYEDSATRLRSTGGIMGMITTTNDTTSDWLTVGGIESALQAAYDLGGGFTTVMARPAAFGALNNGEGSERVTTQDVNDARRGRRRASVVLTEFGEINLARNRWLKSTDAIGYTPEQFSMRTLRPLQTVRLAKVDDTDTFLLVCEAGFMLKGQAHAVKWTGLDPSAAMPSVLV